jgi:hypothetical protein
MILSEYLETIGEKHKTGIFSQKQIFLENYFHLGKSE